MSIPPSPSQQIINIPPSSLQKNNDHTSLSYKINHVHTSLFLTNHDHTSMPITTTQQKFKQLSLVYKQRDHPNPKLKYPPLSFISLPPLPPLIPNTLFPYFTLKRDTELPEVSSVVWTAPCRVRTLSLPFYPLLIPMLSVTPGGGFPAHFTL